MKKFIYIITLLFTATAYSQKGFNVEIIAQPGLSMGGRYEIKDGFGYYDPWENESKIFTFGLNTGAQIGYNFNNKLGISMGLCYSQQGQKYNYNLYRRNLIRTVNLNYLKLPIQFCYIKASEKRVSFTLSTGLYFAYLLNYKDENNDGSIAKGTSYTVTHYPTNYTFKIEPYKSIDFGGILSAGLQFKLLDKIYIPVKLNYQIGMINIKNKNSYYTYGNLDFYQYWGDITNSNTYNTYPNKTLPYNNSSLELEIALKIML